MVFLGNPYNCKKSVTYSKIFGYIVGMKLAFLSCDDLTSFVVDDNYLFDALAREWPELKYDVLSWSDKNITWAQYDVAILRTTWDYTKNRELFLQTLDLIQKQGCRVFNSLKIIAWNSHKSYLRDLQKLKVSIIESYFLDAETIDSLALKLIEDQIYVLKPIVGASAEAIKVLSKLDLLSAIAKLEKPEDWFIQPFMKEVLDGERSIFFFNSKYSHACKKVPKLGDFRVQEEHGGLITSYSPSAVEIDFAASVLKVIDENLLYSRIDYLMTPNGPQLIELELIEPSLYFRTNAQAASNFIKAIQKI